MKVVDGKPIATEDSDLTEGDAAEYDNLLSENISVPPRSDVTDADATAAEVGTVSTTDTNDKKKVASVVIKKVKEELMVKRPWAVLAECDDKSMYERDFPAKRFEFLRDIKAWVKLNVTDYEDGKMFQSLLSCERNLFSNPGLEDHVNATDFINEVMTKQKKSNSFDIGCLAFIRSLIKNLFKDKARGLVLRNIEQMYSSKDPYLVREKFGIFIDAIINTADVVINNGRTYYEMTRFQLETVKNEYASFLTDNTSNSYPIEVYCKDLNVHTDEWIVLLLEHTSYCWDTVAMMKHKSKRLRTVYQFTIFTVD